MTFNPSLVTRISRCIEMDSGGFEPPASAQAKAALYQLSYEPCWHWQFYSLSSNRIPDVR